MVKTTNSNGELSPINLEWKGVLSIEQVSSLYQDLLKAFQHSQTIVVDLSNVTSMDTSIIQLICSAFKEALAENKEFHLIGTIQPLLQTTLVRYGFIMQEEPTGEALEKQWCMQTKGSL